MHSRPSVRPAQLLLLALVALAPACRRGGGSSDELLAGGVKEREVPPVRVTELEQREMVRVLESTSKLESEREVELYPELGGTAIEVLAEEGDVVSEGQLLARIDPRDEDLALKDAEVALSDAKDNLQLADLAVEEATDQLESASQEARQAERDFQRDEQLFETIQTANPLSVQQLETRRLERDMKLHAEGQAKIVLRRRKLERQAALTAIDRATVARDRAEVNRRKKDIVAPFDGVISMRNIRIGDQVGTGEPAFVLTDTENLRAMFARPQEELGLFSSLGASTTATPANGGGAHPESGLSITATAEAYPGHTYIGWVERISPTIDADSGQFRVIARLRHSTPSDPESRSAVLLPGMLVRMKIVTDRHPDALVVPKRALRREGDRRYVLRVEEEAGESIVRNIDVVEGYADEELIEISPLEEGALRPGDPLVLIGSRDLREGDPVRVDAGPALAAE